MSRMEIDEDVPFTLKQLRVLSPDLASALDRGYTAKYDFFVENLYDDLDEMMVVIERGRDVRANDSEDRTTEEIVSFLIGRGYVATANSHQSGHCDVTVTNKAGLVWLGEAKKHSDYDYLWKGFNQLTTRYSTGTATASAGGMLIYIRTQKPGSEVLSEWRERLGIQELPDYSDADCARRPGLAFYSEHKHELSGKPYKVRHMGILMKFEPKDEGAKLKKAGEDLKGDASTTPTPTPASATIKATT
jgi:hypothetical protein